MSIRIKKRSEGAKVDWKALQVVHPDAAGIDIGGKDHWVAISPERDPDPVRCYECFTPDLKRMADWLVERGVRSVALQSTGVYWMPVFEILEQRGLEVYLVNARHTKNLPGRKSDIAECQWLLKLHTFGLLNNSFQPTNPVRAMRTLWRHRAGLVAQAGSAIQRMQKALIEMNIQVSMEGYLGYRKQIAECDQQLRQHLQTMESKLDLEKQPIGPRPKRKRARGNAPKFDLRTELYRLTGVDWSQVDGIDVQVAQTIIAEVGTDLKAFPSEKHFANWLGLCPTNETSGGKVLNRRTPKVINRAKVAFRQAASALLRSKSYLGAQYRRLRTRLGAPKAITAMARKLACLFYRLLTKGQQYVDKGADYYETRHREQQIRSVLKRAQQLGLQVVVPEGQTA